MRAITYSKSALKVLRRLPANEAARITTKVSQYAQDPSSLGNNVKALKGSPYIRLRIGDWRVVMDDRGHVLAVIALGARGSIYD